MKHLKRATLCCFLIGIFFSFSLLSCGGKDDDAKPKNESYAIAHVAIGNGIAFDFKGEHSVGISAMKNKLGIGFLDTKKGISVYLAISASGGELKEATYSVQNKDVAETGAIAYLTLNPVDSDLFPDQFDSRANLDDDVWNEGTGSITITSLKGNWVEGTFSVVAYSQAGNEARITDGKFKVKVDYEF